MLVSLRCAFFNFFSRGQTGSSKQGFQAGPRKNGVKSAQPHNPSVLLTLRWKNSSCSKSRSKGSVHHFSPLNRHRFELGTLRSDDGDGNGNVKKAIG